MKIIVRGLRSEACVHASRQAGVDLVALELGLMAKRAVSVTRAKQLLPGLGAAERIGVFANAQPAEVYRLAQELSLQWAWLEGHESPDQCAAIRRDAGIRVLKRVPVTAEMSPMALQAFSGAVDGFVLHFGHSERETVQDWDNLARLQVPGLVLLGGLLTPQNIVKAIRAVRPWGVVAYEGILIQGKMDVALLAAFGAAARGAAQIDAQAEPTLSNPAVGFAAD